MPTVLITGSAKRIGKALALFFAKKGCDVALHFNSSETEALEIATQIRFSSRRCELFQADLSQAPEAENLIQKVVQSMGDIALLINSASLFKPGTIQATDLENYNRHLSVNITAPFLLSKTYAQHHKSGQIINITDANTRRYKNYYAAYALSKNALEFFTQMAAQEFAPHIRVNAISPGWILDSENPGSPPSSLLSRRGDPQDICEAAWFLYSQNYITGEILRVDGGSYHCSDPV